MLEMCSSNVPTFHGVSLVTNITVSAFFLFSILAKESAKTAESLVQVN